MATQLTCHGHPCIEASDDSLPSGAVVASCNYTMTDSAGLYRIKSLRDRGVLARLASFHYALAALQMLTAATLAAMLMDSTLSNGGAWAHAVSWTLASSVAALAVLTFIAGRRIVGRQAYSYCLTVAAMNCFFFPFGTLIGILTLLTLKRPAVREAFPPSRPCSPNIDAWENRTLP